MTPQLLHPAASAFSSGNALIYSTLLLRLTKTGHKGCFRTGCAPTPVFTRTTTLPKNHPIHSSANWKLPIFIIPFVRAGKDCAGVSLIKYPVSVPVKAFATPSNNTILFHIDSTWFFSGVRGACYCRFFPVHDGVCPVCFL
jgi:hypothetical protein